MQLDASRTARIFNLNAATRTGILLQVFWLKRHIALLLLALWLPVTMHCALEAAPFFAFLQCCCGSEGSPETQSDCADVACSALESGLAKVEDNTPTPAAPLLVLVFSFADTAESVDTTRPVAAEPQPPPELISTWQFASRAALSPRAPSSLV